MDRVPVISEIDVQNWVGTKSYQKGYRYYEDEAILNPRMRGQTLIAECQGSLPTPYRVEVRLGPEGIAWGNCTCSAGEGGHCKHAAALLLTWLHEVESFVEVPELDTLLENRSKDELVSLIQQMVARHPDLEQMLELSALVNLEPGEPLDADLIAQQVRRAFTSAGGEAGGDNAQIASNLEPILDLGEDLLDRDDVINAAIIYRTLMETILTYDDCLYHDEGGDLGQVMAECEQGIEECLQTTQRPIVLPNGADVLELRSGLLRSLFDLFVWDLQAGGLGYADETPAILSAQANVEEKQRIAEWVQAELPNGEDWDEDYQRRALGGLWLMLLGDQLNDTEYLRICQETRRTQDLIDRLLYMGRVDEALATAKQAGRYNLTTIADLFEEHGHPEIALELVQAQPQSETDIQLLEWLKQYAYRHDQPEEAMRLAESLFWQAQTLENYYALLEASAALGKRDSVRARVLERLESAGNFSLLVEIYLLENEIDLALGALERVNPNIWSSRISILRRQVAQAVEVPRPHEAIRQYLLLAEDLIEHRTRGSYAEAARLLQQIRKLYRGLSEEDRWQQILTGLRQEYRRLPAFMDELRRAGL